jgi:hypothetical protein
VPFSPSRHLFPHLLEVAEPITVVEARAAARRKDITAVSTNEVLRPATWRLLDEELFARRPDVRLVVRGSEYDLSFAATLKHVRRFAAHPVWRPKAIESLARIPKLELLSLNSFYLDSFEFLRELSARHLKTLWLGHTKSAKPSLAPLGRFTNLRTLYVEFQQKDIEVIGELRALEDLTFRSVSVPNLDFLRPLKRLRSLDLKLGSIGDLSVIAEKESLRYLELWQVKGVKDVEIAARLPRLQYLFLQSLTHVKRLPAFTRSKALRRVHLQNMKALRDVSGLVSAPALEELVLYEGGSMNPDVFEPVLAKRSLKRATGGFGSKSKNARFVAIAEKHGVRSVEGPFRFRGAR